MEMVEWKSLWQAILYMHVLKMFDKSRPASSVRFV